MSFKVLVKSELKNASCSFLLAVIRNGPLKVNLRGRHLGKRSSLSLSFFQPCNSLCFVKRWFGESYQQCKSRFQSKFSASVHMLKTDILPLMFKVWPIPFNFVEA